MAIERNKKNKDGSWTTVSKDYAEVNQRIKAFRMVHPNGAIVTDIISHEDGVVLMQAIIKDSEGKVIATGYAHEDKKSSQINSTSYIENCETSAVGRALGMCGFGIDTSVASYEEVKQAQAQQEEQKAENKSSEEPSKWPRIIYDPATDNKEKPVKAQLTALMNADPDLVMKLLGAFKVNQTNMLTRAQAAACLRWINEVKESKSN